MLAVRSAMLAVAMGSCFHRLLPQAQQAHLGQKRSPRTHAGLVPWLPRPSLSGSRAAALTRFTPWKARPKYTSESRTGSFPKRATWPLSSSRAVTVPSCRSRRPHLASQPLLHFAVDPSDLGFSGRAILGAQPAFPPNSSMPLGRRPALDESAFARCRGDSLPDPPL